MVEQFQHRVPETVNIGEHHGLVMTAELRPGHDLHDLLERADTSGERDERISAVEHGMLALMHVFGDDQFIKPVLQRAASFLAQQEAWYDAADASAGVKAAGRDGSHDPDGSAAKDQAQSRPCENAAECRPRLMVEIVVSG